MSKLLWHVTMSLDGFIAGPDDSMDWVIAQWSENGTTTRDINIQRSNLAAEVLQHAGAILGGRRWYDVAVRKFGGYDGIYGGEWTGPVFVLTHGPPPDEHHPAITFLSTELDEAVATATKAAAGRDVVVFGANLATQCVRAGLLDELIIHLAPVLLGNGVRLIDASDLGPVPLERTFVGTAGQLTELRFSVYRDD